MDDKEPDAVPRTLVLDPGVRALGTLAAEASLARLSDGGLLALVSGEHLELWSIDGPLRKLAQAPIAGSVAAMVFDPEGARLWVAVSGRLTVFDTDLRPVFDASLGKIRSVWSLAFDDGEIVVTGEVGPDLYGAQRLDREGRRARRPPPDPPPYGPDLWESRWLTDRLSLKCYRGEVVVRDEVAAQEVGGWKARIATWRLGSATPPEVAPHLDRLASDQRWRAWVEDVVEDRRELWGLRTGRRVAAITSGADLDQGFAVAPGARWAVALSGPPTVFELTAGA